MNHGLMSQVLGQLGDELHIPGAVRPGVQPELGRREQHLHGDRDRELRADIDRGRCADQHRSGESFECRRVDHGVQPAESSLGLQSDPVATQTVSQWYNPACFVSPSSLQVGPGYGFGNAPIGNMQSMRLINVDVVLAKNIHIGETKTAAIPRGGVQCV